MHMQARPSGTRINTLMSVITQARGPGYRLHPEDKVFLSLHMVPSGLCFHIWVLIVHSFDLRAFHITQK